ncbi:MAG TPA: ATPase, T2SS/T4P/T4SS family [Paenibacillus sp.]|nr:ATPase, T2SS/T4P/T4SS family [Paenibacillus sp.]
MSLLERIQAKRVDASTEAEPRESAEASRPPAKDVVASFRELRRGEAPARGPRGKEPSPKQSKHQELKNRLHKQILEELKEAPVEDILPKLDAMAIDIIKEDETLRGSIDRKKVVDELVNDLTGYGPINPLLLDPEVSEVMVNGPEQVYVERAGKLELTGVTFRDNEHVMGVIERIVAPIGRRIDESSPMVDARLPDGSRVNVIIPPLALNGPTITIRKFSQDPFTMEDLIGFGTMSEEMASFLDACVKARLNIFVSGGTGSGKTTTLNVLSACIPSDERIVIGEVRGGEALDMLQAMNTGHDGSLATGHSNSPRDMLSRLETMVLMAGIELPVKAIREQIAGALDVIIQQSRLKDGTRKITHITEVQGMEGDTIVLQDIFVFEQRGVDAGGRIVGKLVPTGVRPKFYERLETSGIYIPPTVFIDREEWGL